MEFFYVVKATQKSGKEDAVIWFTAKSEARANLQLDVELEDAGIETGRGKDYAKPVRTNFPVYNNLPEESTVDYTWCKRYELQDDGRTWLPKAGSDSAGPVDKTAAPEPTFKVETTVESVPVENRTPAVRYAVHLTSDKYQSHITKEQQLAASEMSLDESNTYLQNLLRAKNDIPEVAELSLNAEWKLVQAIKQVFVPDETHEAEVIAAFMADWTRADAGDRNQLVAEWRSGKLNLLKSEITSDADVTTGQDPEPETGIQIDENDDETTRYPVVRMPFRKQLLAQFTADELRHHLTREEYEGISALEMDTDNSYVQNLLLAAENCEEVKGYDTKDLWRYTDAIRKVFSQDKRHELALVLRFTRIWAATDYIDRGILVREWATGNRISNVKRTDSGTNADGGYVTDRGEGAHHTLDTLDLEIACALLPMDFRHFEIPSSVLRRAKEIVAKKEEPWKSWSAILRNQPGILAVTVFVDELLDAWRDNPGEKILVTRQQLATARAIQSALLAHPTAGMLLTHPSRAVEVSYFGFDDETGLEVRVRPDLEIELDGVRIGADLKTISMWNVKQESLRARLHREIIDRDYHLSAAMYCETAALDQFFWIFVNKDENYHWIAIIEASTELLELGMLEYRKTMRAIATSFDTGEWPAPITTDYTDELNDFDLRRLEALRAQA
ncbi:RecE family exodeoxyribonuclease [Enterobacter hormaechei]|uniref:RecE family exodeoxyribonuclease n=1 Tax=Enterobacter hormaechei TaxID=158836 RepID=UPI0028588D4E|nr:PD-(D/E)XK nuclease-like domain-containing protein [Enterobacter hormaechei]ELC7457436.1 PD-(D/E)XK nuclease-like domain-containing protein [Enterobacter hormaechei]